MNKAIHIFKILMVAILSLVPFVVTLYVRAFVDPNVKFLPIIAHTIIAVGVAIIATMFALTAYKNYRRSGDQFLRYLTIGFVGFAVLFAPHGFTTAYQAGHAQLFELFGAASRLVLASFVLLATIKISQPAKTSRGWKWIVPYLLVFLAIDIVLHSIGRQSDDLAKTVTLWMEIAAVAVFVCSVAALLVSQRKMTILMRYHLISLAVFAQASIAFILSYREGGTWSHVWWLAHAIFAVAFILLGYAICVAYERTGSFASVFSEEDLLQQVREKARLLEVANTDLKGTNDRLTDLSVQLNSAVRDRDEALQAAKTHAAQLEEVSKHMMGREQRILELKKEIAQLKGKG